MTSIKQRGRTVLKGLGLEGTAMRARDRQRARRARNRDQARLGPDGLPLAWRFRYALAGPEDHAPLASAPTPAPTASDPLARTWRFTWNLLSTRPAQEL